VHAVPHFVRDDSDLLTVSMVRTVVKFSRLTSQVSSGTSCGDYNGEFVTLSGGEVGVKDSRRAGGSIASRRF